MMPYGRGWRRRWGVPGRAHGVRRFVEPCLLLLLHQDDSHGYDLLERLKDLGLGQEPVDSSVVYRYLRDMEDRGFVASTWDTEGTGPPRRVYRLTAEGDQYLAWWIDGLSETRRVLDRFLQAYGEHMRLEEHSPMEERIVKVDNQVTS
jgi:PadR family transcriptional regulator PadR